MTEKLKQLLGACKGSVTLTVNGHRDTYNTVALALDDLLILGFDVVPEVRKKMIETDTMIDLHCYPRTPVCFFKVLHYDLDAALDVALELASSHGDQK
jgi:hypothetical protein